MDTALYCSRRDPAERVLARQVTADVFERYGGGDHIRQLHVARPGDWEISEPGSRRILHWINPTNFYASYKPVK